MTLETSKKRGENSIIKMFNPNFHSFNMEFKHKNTTYMPLKLKVNILI